MFFVQFVPITHLLFRASRWARTGVCGAGDWEEGLEITVGIGFDNYPDGARVQEIRRRCLEKVLFKDSDTRMITIAYINGYRENSNRE